MLTAFFYTGEFFTLGNPVTGAFVCNDDTYTKTENLMESIPEDKASAEETQPFPTPNTEKPKQTEISYSSWLPIETDDEYLKKLTPYRDAWVTVMETVLERRYYPESGNVRKSYKIESNMEYILQDRESMIELIEIVKQAEPMDTSVLHGATGIRIADIRFDFMNIHIDRYGDYILFDIGYTGILGLVYNGDESDINDLLKDIEVTPW